MRPKTKLKLKSPLVFWMIFRSKSLAKKIAKADNADRYPEQWKTKYVLKKAKKMAKTLNIKLEVEGFENIPKTPALIVPNHSSAFDGALMLMALEDHEKGPDKVFHNAVFLAKKELETNKKTKGFLNILNTFYIDRENFRDSITQIDQMIEYSKSKKKHVIVFPEGTRSIDGQIGEFKSAAFKIAKNAFLPILPVTINNALSIMDLEREGKLKVKIIFHPIIKPMSFMTVEANGIAQKVWKIVNDSWTKPEGKRSEKESEIA